MALFDYDYSLTTDFPRGLNNAKLVREIQASDIAAAVDRVDTEGDAVKIYFKKRLTRADQAILDGYTGPGSSDSSSVEGQEPASGVIAAHDGLPDPVPVTSVSFQSPQLVGIAPVDIGDRLWDFTHDFCDKTTWYGDSVRVVGEAVGTGDGSTTIFDLANDFVVDTAHGKVSNEDYLIPTASQTGSTYRLIVKVNGVTKTEEEFGLSAPNDYSVDYATGVITFHTAPANGAAITADYFYSPPNAGSAMYFRPPSGGVLTITQVELQFSTDVVMNDELDNGVFTYNPGLGAPPAKFLYPLSQVKIKRTRDLVNWSSDPYPGIPAFGGGVRGHTNPWVELHMDYISPLVLPAAAGAELRIWLKNHIPFGGEFAAATVRGTVS